MGKGGILVDSSKQEHVLDACSSLINLRLFHVVCLVSPPYQKPILLRTSSLVLATENDRLPTNRRSSPLYVFT